MTQVALGKDTLRAPELVMRSTRLESRLLSSTNCLHFLIPDPLPHGAGYTLVAQRGLDRVELDPVVHVERGR